ATPTAPSTSRTGASSARRDASRRSSRPALTRRCASNSGSLVRWARDSILFSSCNEDTACELRALGDLSGARVFAVTAGGGRVLSRLVGGPATIVAVDLTP